MYDQNIVQVGWESQVQTELQKKATFLLITLHGSHFVEKEHLFLSQMFCVTNHIDHKE